jgi:hypothetical protein
MTFAPDISHEVVGLQSRRSNASIAYLISGA